MMLWHAPREASWERTEELESGACELTKANITNPTGTECSHPVSKMVELQSHDCLHFGHPLWESCEQRYQQSCRWVTDAQDVGR